MATVDSTTITVSDVRKLLSNISSTIIADDVIQQRIEQAEFQVLQERSEDCDQATFDNAVLWHAAYLTILLFNLQYETAEGEAYPNAMTFLEKVEREAMKYMGYATRGTKPPGPARLLHDKSKASSSLVDFMWGASNWLK